MHFVVSAYIFELDKKVNDAIVRDIMSNMFFMKKGWCSGKTIACIIGSVNIIEADSY